MKPSQVIKFFLGLSKYRLTMYQISKNAGIGTGVVTKIVDEKQQDVSLSTLQKIANGLARINPYFEPVFWALITTKDIVPTPTNPIGWTGELYVDPAEEPEVISRVIQQIAKRYPLLAQEIEAERKAFEAQCAPFELDKIISLQMRNERREEE